MAETKVDQSQLTLPSSKVLWSGVYYMAETQTATLSENVTAQATGIILVWSRYSGGAAQNDSWNYTYVPKWHVQNFDGSGVTCTLGAGTGADLRKYVYVHNTHINGNAINDDAPNNAQVLRYVLGY